MKLVAKIRYNYNKSITYMVNILKGDIKKIDIFTSKFKNPKQLEEYLESYLKENISSVHILEIFLLDDNYKNPISILYNKYAFIADNSQKNLLISKIKYLDPSRLEQFFKSNIVYSNDLKIEDSEIYECLLSELEKTNGKPNSIFYSKLHNFLCRDYLIRRKMAMSVLCDNEFKEFRKVNYLSDSIYDSIMIKFLRRVLVEKMPNIDCNNEYNLYDEDCYEVENLSETESIESYIYNIVSNYNIPLDEKLEEISLYTDITPHIYELADKNS